MGESPEIIQDNKKLLTTHEKDYFDFLRETWTAVKPIYLVFANRNINC